MVPLHPKFHDKIIGEAVSLVSAATVHVSPFGKWLVGSEAPTYQAVHWQRADTQSIFMRDWAEFEGDPQAGRIPSQYRKAAILTLNKTILDEQQEKHGGQHAVAFALGTAVMVGALPEGQTFGWNVEADPNYKVALRIGRGVLQATAGIWSQSDRFLDVPQGTLIHKSTASTEELPEHIPLV